MVEKFLLDLFRRSQKQKVAILIDGEYTSTKMLKALPVLMEKLREFGEIKLAEVLYDSKISDAEYKALIEIGFTQNIVAGNLDLHFLFQCYDIILSDNSIDMIVIGTQRENLIPLYTEMRKEATTYALVDKHLTKSFEECFDGVILLDKIDEFSFASTDLSEVSSLVSPINGNGNGSSDNGHDDISIDEIIPDANIGPISDSMEEQSELIEELKGQEINETKAKLDSQTDDLIEEKKASEDITDAKASTTKKKAVKKSRAKTRTTATKKVRKKSTKKSRKR